MVDLWHFFPQTKSSRRTKISAVLLLGQVLYFKMPWALTIVDTGIQWFQKTHNLKLHCYVLLCSLKLKAKGTTLEICMWI